MCVCVCVRVFMCWLVCERETCKKPFIIYHLSTSATKHDITCIMCTIQIAHKYHCWEQRNNFLCTWSVKRGMPCMIIRELQYMPLSQHSKRSFIMTQEPCITTKEFYVKTKEFYVKTKETCITTKVICIKEKETCDMIKGPCIITKELYIKTKRNLYHDGTDLYVIFSDLQARLPSPTKKGGYTYLHKWQWPPV